jgi:hypothetical protein
MSIRVQVQSQVYGNEDFEYESLEEALAGIKRLYSEAVDSGDGLQRVIGLIAEGNCDGCSGRRWCVVAPDGEDAPRRIARCDLCSAKSLEEFEAVAMVVGFLHDFGCRIQVVAGEYELSLDGWTRGSWPTLQEAAAAGVQLIDPQLAI